MGKWAENHPEHCRTSCSDEGRENADPTGTGCHRCTALVMDAAQPPAAGVDVSEAAIFRAADALCAKWNLHYPDAVSMAKTALTAALRTGGGA